MTAVWLSSAVEKTSFFVVGMVVLRSISLVITPPRVSMPSDNGVTSSEQHVGLAAQQELRPLDGGADGDHFVGIDALVALLAEDFLDQLLHARHARHAADQHHLVDVARLVAGVLERLQHRAAAALDQTCSTSCSNLARVSVSLQVLGPRGVGGDERQIDVGRASAATGPSWPARTLP